MRWEEFDWLLDAALVEDRAREDVTTRALVPEGRMARAVVRAGAAGVVCGLPLAHRIAERFDKRLRFEECTADGERVRPGGAVARLEGPAASILAVERPMLNFLQRLSGISTLTARYVEAVAGTEARVYDTRKTTPGWRALEKWAVRCGGGCNHRMDLAEQALIKDNHLALMGASRVRAAVERVRRANPGVPVEVEVEDMAQLEEALSAGPDMILLDNMTPDEVRRAVEFVREKSAGARPQVEASGGITLQNVAAFARAGADRISVGALTHSAPAFDLSLEVLPD